jgi:hypothetical protein
MPTALIFYLLSPACSRFDTIADTENPRLCILDNSCVDCFSLVQTPGSKPLGKLSNVNGGFTGLIARMEYNKFCIK